MSSSHTRCICFLGVTMYFLFAQLFIVILKGKKTIFCCPSLIDKLHEKKRQWMNSLQRKQKKKIGNAKSHMEVKQTRRKRNLHRMREKCTDIGIKFGPCWIFLTLRSTLKLVRSRECRFSLFFAVALFLTHWISWAVKISRL